MSEVTNGISKKYAERVKGEVKAHGLIKEMPHPAMGTCRLVGSPLRLSGTPVAEPFHPPMLGEHTAEVLTDVLGMDAAEAADYAERVSAKTD